MRKSAAILAIGGVAAIMLILGVAIGSIAFPATKTETTTTTQPSTVTQTILTTTTSTETVFPFENVTSLSSFPLVMINRPQTEFLELSRTGGYGIEFTFLNISRQNISGITILSWNYSESKQLPEELDNFYNLTPNHVLTLDFAVEVRTNGTWILTLKTADYNGALLCPVSMFTFTHNSSGYTVT